MPHHVVADGECINSIAMHYGFFWETLWDAPENAELKARRRDPNVLAAGDRLFIPVKTEKTLERATGRRHVFRRRGVPAWFRLELFDEDGQPRAGLVYTLDVDGVITTGSTSGSGGIAVPISPAARRALLRLGDGGEAYAFQLGHLDPVDTIRGAQARLRNLSFLLDTPTGQSDPATEHALRTFQQSEKLAPSGELDAPTQAALEGRHGS